MKNKKTGKNISNNFRQFLKKITNTNEKKHLLCFKIPENRKTAIGRIDDG